MIIQYSESFSSCPAQIQNIVANDVSLLERYCLIQTGQYEWTALIQTIGTNKTRLIRFTRSGSNYSSYYEVEREDVDSFEATIINEYYAYSNDGYGNSLDLPVYDGCTSWALMIISCILMFAIVFKGALFKCLDIRRRKL